MEEVSVSPSALCARVTIRFFKNNILSSSLNPHEALLRLIAMWCHGVWFTRCVPTPFWPPPLFGSSCVFGSSPPSLAVRLAAAVLSVSVFLSPSLLSRSLSDRPTALRHAVRFCVQCEVLTFTCKAKRALQFHWATSTQTHARTKRTTVRNSHFFFSLKASFSSSNACVTADLREECNEVGLVLCARSTLSWRMCVGVGAELAIAIWFFLSLLVTSCEFDNKIKHKKQKYF